LSFMNLLVYIFYGQIPQSLVVPSELPELKSVPSGDNQREVTKLECAGIWLSRFISETLDI